MLARRMNHLSSESDATDLRNAPRHRTLKGARIILANGNSTMACRVRDESATGAQLIIEKSAMLPDNFTLIFDGDTRRVPCAVVWRKQDRLGVRFDPRSGENHSPAAADPSLGPARHRILKRPIQI